MLNVNDLSKENVVREVSSKKRFIVKGFSEHQGSIVVVGETYSVWIEQLEGVLLDKETIKLLGSRVGIYHIQYFHQLQNYYYYTKGRKLIQLNSEDREEATDDTIIDSSRSINLL